MPQSVTVKYPWAGDPLGVALRVCVVCGREVYADDRCPGCGLAFCEEHLPPGSHNCIDAAQKRNERRNWLFLGLEVFVFLLVGVHLAPSQPALT